MRVNEDGKLDRRRLDGRATAAWLGRVDYPAAWAWQRDLFLARLDGDIDDAVMLLEHPPTFTLGRRALEEDLVWDEARRRARGIEVFKVDRGGRATYHGPGQLVGYPILELGERYDVMSYLRKLEEVLIRTAADLGVRAGRDLENTGVWVGQNKLGAIGVKITRGITMHGFAFNVNTDLSMFEGIVPCGLRGRWVTSVAEEIGTAPSVKEVASIAADHLAEVFDRSLAWAHPTTLLSSAAHDRKTIHQAVGTVSDCSMSEASVGDADLKIGSRRE
ncbi:MAG: lipoyl(octanoyl) transferase LipB [Actinomycetota bacterium]|nr:lipoyl(octanoyl) transferase LipB [Actinomycetota bacterium]